MRPDLALTGRAAVPVPLRWGQQAAEGYRMNLLPQAREQLTDAGRKLHHKGPYVHSLTLTGLVLAGYLLGYGLDQLVPTHVTATVIGALWSAVTVLTVFKDHWADTRASFWSTLSSTVIGAVAALLYLLYFPQKMLALALVMALSLLFSQLVGFNDRGRQVVSTVLLIVIFSHLNSSAPWLNAGMRLAEVLVGALVGLVGGYMLRKASILDEE